MYHDRIYPMMCSDSWSRRRDFCCRPQETGRWSCHSPCFDSPADAQKGQGWTTNLQSIRCTQSTRWRSYILTMLVTCVSAVPFQRFIRRNELKREDYLISCCCDWRYLSRLSLIFHQGFLQHCWALTLSHSFQITRGGIADIKDWWENFACSELTQISHHPAHQLE